MSQGDRLTQPLQEPLEVFGNIPLTNVNEPLPQKGQGHPPSIKQANICQQHSTNLDTPATSEKTTSHQKGSGLHPLSETPPPPSGRAMRRLLLTDVPQRRHPNLSLSPLNFQNANFNSPTGLPSFTFCPRLIRAATC